MKELKDEISRLHAENTTLQQGYDAARLEIDARNKQLVKEAARTAEEKLRADRMTEQHRMQCQMREGLDREIEALRMRSAAPAGEYPPLPMAYAMHGPEGIMSCYSADQLRAYVDADRALRAQAAPAAVTGPVAYRVLRKRHDGEWVTDGRAWCDGVPTQDLVDDIALRSDGWRIEYAFAAPTAQAAPGALSQAAQDVLAELERATRKFPTWPTDPLHALAVLGEEFGELTKDMLQLTYEPHKTNAANVRTEALQTAAMALRLFMSLDRYEYRPGVQHSQQKGGA